MLDIINVTIDQKVDMHIHQKDSFPTSFDLSSVTYANGYPAPVGIVCKKDQSDSDSSAKKLLPTFDNPDPLGMWHAIITSDEYKDVKSFFNTYGNSGNSVTWPLDKEFKVPALDDLNVYELQVEEFEASFDGVIPRLDYLTSLGVDALELVPITAESEVFDWGYGSPDYFAPSNHWGDGVAENPLQDYFHTLNQYTPNELSQHLDLSLAEHNMTLYVFFDTYEMIDDNPIDDFLAGFNPDHPYHKDFRRSVNKIFHHAPYKQKRVRGDVTYYTLGRPCNALEGSSKRWSVVRHCANRVDWLYKLIIRESYFLHCFSVISWIRKCQWRNRWSLGFIYRT